MCGIAFIINSSAKARRTSAVNSKLEDMFSDMLMASTVRGTDGTGVFQITDNGDEYVYRRAVNAVEAITNTHKSVAAYIKDVPIAPITVAHVRAATRGKVSDENTHPFIASIDGNDMLIGVHNGTLYGWEDNTHTYDVDSEWAFNEIATRGHGAISEFYGAYAMVWYDSRHQSKVFIARNSQRPLHVAWANNGSTIIGASEAGMIQWLAEKNGITISDVYSIDTDIIMSVDHTQEHLSFTKESDIEDVWTAHNTTNTTFANGVLDERDYFLKEVGRALEAARKENVTSAAAEEDYGEEQTESDDTLVYAQHGWYNLSQDTADVNSTRRAIQSGTFGMVVDWESVKYDGIQQCIIGEIVSPKRLKQPLAYQLDVNANEAVEEGCHTMVIVGERPFGKNDIEYIVAPLNDAGVAALMV